jgi:uncharacterized protein YegJ (DUF2314 family)
MSFARRPKSGQNLDRRVWVNRMKTADGLAAIVLIAVAAAASGQSPIEQARKDELAFVPRDDPAMRQAFIKARKSLDLFLNLVEGRPPYLRSPSVKVDIAEGEQVEYFWISSFTRMGDRFSGLINNQPRLVKNVKSGQAYEFTKSQIVDWMFIDARNNRMTGNHTACALLTREPPEQAAAFKRQYGLECEP